MTRILILSASAGAGHNRAAEAIRESAKAYCPGVETEWVDTLKYTNKVFAKLYEQTYVWMASYSPSLWGVLYKQAGRNTEHRKITQLIELHDRLTYRKLMQRVEEFKPDVAICTHFLPAYVLLAKRVNIPIYVVITDFDAHSLWVLKKAAGYFVASDEVKVQLARYGYPAAQIRATGIPIHPVFSQETPREPSPKPQILFMSGGMGMGHMEKALERILDIRVPFSLTVVAGKNESMRKKLEKMAGDRATVHGFVSNVHELMGKSDLIITKAGGLTVSECLAKKLPMVIFSPIPGQEECNADYLLEHGCAVKARTLDVLDYKVLELLENPARLDMMRRACGAAARASAGRDLLRHVLDENSTRG
ncbi:MAG: glycosyltransferase [Planctomycetes bacterium]|nr:glycosyltransferase [Planctomycetota bacterium]